MNGSRVIAKMAGMLSMAKTRSLHSITSRTQQQRRGHSPGGGSDEEVLPLVIGCYREDPSDEPDQRVSVGFDPILTAGAEHPDTGDDQDAAEDVDDPVELADQQGAGGDHDAAHHDRAQDAPLEHPGLQRCRDIEILKDQDEDEEVVDAERQLDEVAGVVLERGLRPLLPVQEPAEQERQDDDPGAPAQRLLPAQHMGCDG